MKHLITFLLLNITAFASAGNIQNYMLEYSKTKKSNYTTEKQIIENYSLPKLVNELSSFYNDSIVDVRRKAYYFTYKKGLISNTKHQQRAVTILLDGCLDKNGAVVGQTLSYLQEFPKESFNEEAKTSIDKLLVKRQITHFKKLALLAGYVGTGEETMRRKLLLPDVKQETRWYFSLALARIGSSEHADYCIEVVKKMPVNNDLVSYIIPDLIYTRQSQALNYCIEILNSDKKNCYSPNPDKPENILCGYQIMELLAPVIIDFPYQTDATGCLVTDNFEKTLVLVRSWFKNNPEFQVNTNIF